MLLAAMLLLSCNNESPAFEPGRISGSQTFSGGEFKPDSNEVSGEDLILIEDDNIILDFGGLVIDARDLHDTPDKFTGTAFHIKNCTNVEIRNLSIHGFRYAILAENVDSLKLINCNFSYNYRPRLYSKWDRESLNDWLYFHDNADWPAYAAAIFLKNCNSSLIRGTTIQQGFNGLMMDGCNDGLIYNNNIRFNSGLGIGMYESSRNRIMHNRLDWNVRGYSHGKYERGQDSAGILLYEQCNDNTIAYNSATHSGDGVFLWAGQHTMDSGEGGCNGNIIYRNDFSHSVANGVEATFSSNIIVNNKLNDCRYGVWGGYSHHTLISNNEIHDCDHGIAIEHGNNNIINNNDFANGPSGIELWERNQQPTGWGYVEARNTASRSYEIIENSFDAIETAISLIKTDSVYLNNNQFAEVSSRIKNSSNSAEFNSSTGIDIYNEISFPDPLEDGMDTELEERFPRGRKYILVNEWGPYNFDYPEIFLRRITDDNSASFDLTLALFGPVGNWKLLPGTRGVDGFRPKSGATPSTIEVKRSPDSTLLTFELGYLGPDHVDQFGDSVSRGSSPNIRFALYDPKIVWEVAYYNFTDTIPPTNPIDFVSKHNAAFSGQRDQLAFTNWGSPVEGINEDHFITQVKGIGNFEKGTYIITLESDDGARLLLDNTIISDTWENGQAAKTEVLEIELNGEHSFEVYHYELEGLSVLDLEIMPLAKSENVN